MSNKKIRDFLTRTGLGLFLIWGFAAAIFLAVILVVPFLGKAQTVAAIAALVVLAVASLWYVAAFTVTLVKRQWRKAALMFVLGGTGACLLAVGFGLAMPFYFWAGAATWKQEDEKPRMAGVPGENGKTAFSVEYINAHPFLAEYDKTIVFKSGKRIGVWMDSGGAGPFAVYRLQTGEYYLVDGLEFDFIRNDYRVNVTNETAEILNQARAIHLRTSSSQSGKPSNWTEVKFHSRLNASAGKVLIATAWRLRRVRESRLVPKAA